MLRKFLPYVFFFFVFVFFFFFSTVNYISHDSFSLNRLVLNLLSLLSGFIQNKKNGAHVTRGRGDSGAEVTGAKVSGAEVVGAEVTRGRSD